MIELKAVSKIYQDGNEDNVVLKGIDMKINENDFITIMGKSGCGKSTLLNIIALLSEPTAGSVYYDGVRVNFRKVKKVESNRRNKIGLVFQNPNLISTLNVYENILLTMTSKEKGKVLDYLDMVGLKDKYKADVRTLSGGEAQRVAIVRAIINQPEVLLCDEPTGALDSESSKLIVDLLLKAQEKTKCGLIIVTHDDEIGSLGKERIVLEGGCLIGSK